MPTREEIQLELILFVAGNDKVMNDSKKKWREELGRKPVRATWSESDDVRTHGENPCVT